MGWTRSPVILTASYQTASGDATRYLRTVCRSNHRMIERDAGIVAGLKREELAVDICGWDIDVKRSSSCWLTIDNPVFDAPLAHAHGRTVVFALEA